MVISSISVTNGSLDTPVSPNTFRARVNKAGNSVVTATTSDGCTFSFSIYNACCPQFTVDDFDITYSAIVSNLNEDERKLVEYKLSDCNYRAAFIKYYKATHGKVITKETFLTIWSKTKKKMWGALQRIKKPDELIGYKKPILR